MKSVVLLAGFLWCSLVAFGQEEDEYYRPPSQRSDVRNNAYPNLDRKSVSLYLGVEGGMEFNQSTLANNLDGLIGKEKGKDLYWGVVLGYNNNDTWSIETGYYKNPTFLVQSVSSGRSIPYVYRFGTGLQTIPVRYKRKILTIDPITKNATIHVGAGVLLSPDAKNKKIGERNFVGTSNTPQKRDTLRLQSEAFLSQRGVAQAEFLVELHGRVSNSLSLVVYARGNIAPKGLIRSEVDYSVNGVTIDKARQLSNGISFNFGLVFRYNLMRGYKYSDKESTE
ncbi:hypothetical protein [Emticicia sp. BO119]|uniref:hypothetical protein n=1 Tax=Emticicia sp. BO119 TaxID=2757768 RepID=UPI0015F074BE|nr:hypothetical protein [Emticicia sp. BO119]MBA4851299.1 hypothetical protein [Emticicia sp. BO119]